MFEFLEQLRRKPDATKKHVVAIVMILIMGSIFGLWLHILSARFGATIGQSASQGSSSAFDAQLKNTAQTINANYQSLKAGLSADLENVVGGSTTTVSQVVPAATSSKAK
jgi:hypothetical protein